MQNVTLTRSDMVQIGLYFASIIVIVAGSYWVAARFRVDAEAVLLLACGLFVAGSTLIRIPFYWDHAKTLFLRLLIGDTAATVVFVAVGVGLGVAGAIRLAYWNDDVRECRRLYARAESTQERVRVLMHVPRTEVPGVVTTFGEYRPLSCGRYRERGQF